MTTVRRRTAFRTYGGKHRLAGWVCRHLPSPLQCHTYVEPFCRAASVYMALPWAYQGHVLADADAGVVAFLTTLRDRPGALMAALAATPYSRQAYAAAQGDVPADHPDPALETARRWYVQCNQSYGARAGVGEGAGGWSLPSANRRSHAVDWEDLSHLPALSARLQLADIRQADAFATIPLLDSPGTVFYVDPPYLAATRHTRWARRAYRHEFTDGDHERLAALLRGCQGYVVLSHTDCAEYDQLYDGWAKCRRGGRSREALYVKGDSR